MPLLRHRLFIQNCSKAFPAHHRSLEVNKYFAAAVHCRLKEASPQQVCITGGLS